MFKDAKLNTCDDWYGFDLKKACKMLGGKAAGVSYLGTICDGKGAIALFHSTNPDVSKGHKEYPYLFTTHSCLFVNAYDSEDVQQHKMLLGAYCHKCKDVIYSCHNHDYRHCSCESINVDGGSHYFRFGHNKGSKYTLVNIDILSGTITKAKEENVEKNSSNI
jgi:hypothetical protein